MFDLYTSNKIPHPYHTRASETSAGGGFGLCAIDIMTASARHRAIYSSFCSLAPDVAVITIIVVVVFQLPQRPLPAQPRIT